MARLLEIPHSVCRYTCMVSGISDVYEWKTGQKLPCMFMMLLSGMAGFTYLKFKRARPSFMVFWGPSVKVQYKNLKKIFGIDIEIKNEGGSFARAMKILKKSIDEGYPAIIGPLDMFNLEYHHEFFMKLHATAHFVLVVGYDDTAKRVHIYDCNFKELKNLSYENLQQAWSADEKGYLKRFSVITFKVPDVAPNLRTLVEKGLEHKADEMLKPPIRNFGIPGIRKLAAEFPKWENWMSKENYILALKNLVMFANVPPTLSREVDNFTAFRREFSTLLKELHMRTGDPRLEQLCNYFKNSGKLIEQLCHTTLDYLDSKEDSRSEAPRLLMSIASTEEEAYNLIERMSSKS
jgi:hypothetical protein